MSREYDKMPRLADLEGFDNKYLTSLMSLGVEYVDDFYYMACGNRVPTQKHLCVDDSEFERLMRLAETVLDEDTIAEARNPDSSSEGFIVDDS